MATLLLGWWSKARCLEDGTWTEGEEYTRYCYSDVFPLWVAERLSEGATPYLDHPVEYPVLTGAQMLLAQQVVELGPESDRARAFYDVTSVLNVVAALAVVALLAAAGLPRRRLLWFAAAPTLALYATLNWDPVPLVLLTGAVVAHLRGRDTVSGVLAGLGVAAKLFPGVLIPFVIAARLAQGRRRAALGHAAGAAGAWLVVNLPVALAAPRGWARFLELNSERVADFDSLWFLAQELGDRQFETSFVNLWSALAFLAGLAVIGVVGTRGRDPSRWWTLALPALVWFLLTNKVYSPQYSLWLLPLCALVLPRLAPYAAFLVADVMVFATRFSYVGGLAGAGDGAPYPVFATAVVLRAAVLVWILVESTVADDPSLTDGTQAADEAGAREAAPVAEPDPPPSRLGAGTPAAALGAGALLAVVMTWPLAARLGAVIPQDLGDPLLQVWQLAWGGHALATAPLSLFQSNTFFPLPDSLAFSDALLGYAPASLVGTGLDAAVVRYGLLFLFAYALAFAGAALLARELGARPLAAALAGVAFAYAPWRLGQNGHLHVISSGGVALAAFLLVRGYRTTSPGLVVAGGAVAAWQVAIGFTLGIQVLYLLVAVGVVGALAVVSRRVGVPRRMLVATGVGGALLLGVAGLQALPYLRVQQAHPEAVRTVEEVAFFSPPPSALLAAPQQSRIWGPLTAPVRDTLPWQPEQTLFPGVAVVVLGVAGAVQRGWPATLRVALAGTAVTSAVFALGLRVAGGRVTYRLLYDLAPGWAGVRTPGRIFTLTTLALAVLAAFGAHAVLRRAEARPALAPLSRTLGVGLIGVVLLEGAGTIPLPEVPAAPPGLAVAEAPRLHLPSDESNDLAYVFWSVDGLPQIVNGLSGFTPDFLAQLRTDVAGFPDAASVARLRELGIESVVVHPERAAGTPWAAAAAKPVDGLGVTRIERGGVVVFDFDP